MRPDDAGRRRFTLGDGMVLIAATAAGLAIARAMLPSGGRGFSAWGLAFTTLHGLATAWSPAVLAIHLRTPRPRLRRLMRRPGFVGTLAASVTIGVYGLAAAALAAVLASHRAGWLGGGLGRTRAFDRWWMAFQVETQAGAAVLATWFVLALSGRRKSAGDWLDGLGHLVGASWLVLWANHVGYLVWVLSR